MAIPVAVAVAVELAVVYLALGWFLLLAWLFGVTAVVLLVRRLPGAERRGAVSVAAAVLLYGGATWAVRNAMAGESYETRRMTWEARGSDNDFGEPEIVLRFVEAPAYHVGMYSADVARHLHGLGVDTVDVTFRIRSLLGCRRSVTETDIGGLERWRSSFGYSGFRGSGGEPPPSPWGPMGWWCP